MTNEPFFSTRLGQFSYFAEQIGDWSWRGKNVLDFGGNIGNILRDPSSTIEHNRYWCLDVVKESIEKGRETYPEAHWVFYDRYCFFFNPYGKPSLPLPDMGGRFDYIVAFSVFTNTTPSDMLQLVEQLRARTAPKGALAFTFIDPYYYSWPNKYDGDNLKWRLDLETERGHISADRARSIARDAAGASWFVLVNGGDLYVESEELRSYEPEAQRTCHVFHTAGHMKTLFPEATILPPVNDEMQHCCIIRNP